jgi:hypothetical protein
MFFYLNHIIFKLKNLFKYYRKSPRKTTCDVFDQHKLGKKHKKNLEKLQAAAVGCSISKILKN